MRKNKCEFPTLVTFRLFQIVLKENKEKFVYFLFTCKKAALSVSFKASIQNCINPVVCCNFPVQFACCSYKKNPNFIQNISNIYERKSIFTLSILIFVSLSLLIASSRYSRLSLIAWISASHCVVTSLSNSIQES